MVEYIRLYYYRVFLPNLIDPAIRKPDGKQNYLFILGACTMNIVEKVFGTHSERELKYIYPIIDKIEKLRPTMQAMTDEELRDQTRKFKERVSNGETLDQILPEAYATVREAAKRVLNMEHYPVQLIGGIVLHQGRIVD